MLVLVAPAPGTSVESEFEKHCILAVGGLGTKH